MAAREPAYSRIEKLDDLVIHRLVNADSLDILADPAFQMTLRKAQMGAAATEREDDYELLASLLAERAAKPSDRPLRAGVSRAIEVVDQLDSTSLSALTLYVVVSSFRPGRVGLDDALDHMDLILSQFMEGQALPQGGATSGWRTSRFSMLFG